MRFVYGLFVGVLVFGTFFRVCAEEEPDIIPRPQKIVIESGRPAFRTGSHSGVITSDASESASRAAGFFKSELPNPPGAIKFAVDSSFNHEAYRLIVGEVGIRLEASDYAGFFNGSRTLKQMLWQMKNGELPAMTITDEPRFKWRGLLFDAARHYFEPEYLYRLIDQLAAVKINVLHLHLTDDEGWRIEIKKYPLLTEKGAWSPKMSNEDLLERESSDNYRADGMYGGFYTQDEMKKLVAYAADRNITIVPEIDIPGHSRSAVSNYPELLKCDLEKDSNVYCAALDSSYEFLEQVLSEIFGIFPSKYIIIGGDEVDPQYWKECSRCQKLIQDKQLNGEEGLQNHFITRIADFCRQNGRIPTGWEDMIKGGDEIPEVAVINWLNPNQSGFIGTKPAEQSREMIIAQAKYLYFDFAPAAGEPVAEGVPLTLEKTYSLDPVPETLAPDKRRFIIGAEGALWTPFTPNGEHAFYMLFPRMFALSEVAWTQPERKNEVDFKKRLQAYLPHLDEYGISYRPDGGLVKVIEKDGRITLTTPIPGAEIYYTLDRKYPTKKSILYTESFTVDNLTNLRIAVFGHKGNRFPVLDRTVCVGKWSISAPEAAPETPAVFAFDDDINAMYRSKAPFGKGSEVRIDFDQPRKISGMHVVTGRGRTGGRDRFIVAGRLLTSADGNNFTEVSRFKKGNADFQGEAMPVKAVRIVADETVEPVLMIREISFYR